MSLGAGSFSAHRRTFRSSTRQREPTARSRARVSHLIPSRSLYRHPARQCQELAHRCRRASDRSLFRTRPSAQDRIQPENSPKTRSELCESPTLSLTAPAVLAAVGCNCGKETGRWVVPAASSNPPGMRRFAGREGLVVCLIWRSCSPKSSSIQVVAGPRNQIDLLNQKLRPSQPELLRFQAAKIALERILCPKKQLRSGHENQPTIDANIARSEGALAAASRWERPLTEISRPLNGAAQNK